MSAMLSDWSSVRALLLGYSVNAVPGHSMLTMYKSRRGTRTQGLSRALTLLG